MYWHYQRVCLEGLRKTIKYLRIADLWAQNDGEE
jgi:hypothetical protein